MTVWIVWKSDFYVDGLNEHILDIFSTEAKANEYVNKRISEYPMHWIQYENRWVNSKLDECLDISEHQVK